MYKILKIVVAVLGLIGAGLLVRIIAVGDDVIKDMFKEGDSSVVEPMTWVAYIMLGLILAFVIVFVVKNLVSNTSNLKNTLIGVGAFLAILLVAYLVSGGDDAEYFYDKVPATANASQMVGAGLVSFYVLSVIAIGTMMFSGIKKMIK